MESSFLWNPEFSGILYSFFEIRFWEENHSVHYIFQQGPSFLSRQAPKNGVFFPLARKGVGVDLAFFTWNPFFRFWNSKNVGSMEYSFFIFWIPKMRENLAFYHGIHFFSFLEFNFFSWPKNSCNPWIFCLLENLLALQHLPNKVWLHDRDFLLDIVRKNSGFFFICFFFYPFSAKKKNK